MKHKLPSLFVTLLCATAAWATDYSVGNEAKLGSSIPEGTVYVTDVMLVGDYWKSDATAAYNSYVQKGWTGINVDLNEGAGTFSHYIYLLYKTNNSPGTSGVPITDFYLRVSESGDAPNSFSYEGRTYQLASYTNGSDDDFRNSKGDLNTNAGGDYKIHLYYTKGEYAPGRAVTSIDIVQPSTNALGNIASDVNVSPFLCENGLTTPCNLNKHAGGAFLCMSVTKGLTEPVTVPDGGVYYIEHGWDNVNKKLTGTVQTLASSEFTKLSNKTGDLTLTAGNYVVQGNVHVEDVIFVTGNTNLILCDGATLRVAKGILVSQDCTLSIFGQAANSGRLVNEQEQENSSDKNVYPGIGTFSSGTTINIHGGTIDVKAKNAYAAGIGNGYGNNKNHEMGTINIYDGKITATGGYYGYLGAAAIGSWDNRANGAINIYGGDITAVSDYYGPAIGTGNCSDEASETVFTITINGGNVVATGGLQAAGIGGGYECVGSTVTINGGRVEAHGGNGGAGIGSGQNDEPISGGTVVVNGGEVYAYGGEIPVGGAAGIGGGEGCHGANVTVNGGKVYAYGVDNAAGIGSGNKHNMHSKPNGGKLTVTGGYVYAEGEGKGAGIGGGEDGAGADVTITGGIVVAQSGGDQRAIGAGYGSDNHSSLTFADNLGVFVTTQLNRSVKENRVKDCRNFAYVRINQCAHGGATVSIVNGENHTVTDCKYCYAGEEIHTFGSNGQCDVCQLISLQDEGDNSAVFSTWTDGEPHSFVISGRKLSAAQDEGGNWSNRAYTVCVPFDMDLVPYMDFMSLYTLSKIKDGKNMVFTQNVPYLEAGTPYLIVMRQGELELLSKDVVLTDTPAEGNRVLDWDDREKELGWWRGTLTKTDCAEASELMAYVLQSDGTFCRITPESGASLNAFRAMYCPDALPQTDVFTISKGILFPAGGDDEDYIADFDPAEFMGDAEITGVKLISGNRLAVSEAGAWYDLFGRKFNSKPTQKGLYIHDGKAVVVGN